MCTVNIFLDVWYSTGDVKTAICSYPTTGQKCLPLVPEANTLKPGARNGLFLLNILTSKVP